MEILILWKPAKQKQIYGQVRTQLQRLQLLFKRFTTKKYLFFDITPI